ncbi:unnamed protein product [Parnassius apollo]|uniref:(apollo) hypothetical protein n=1 Tax=Parnassius apollo TaxID=110799 RepID=A0A8S3WLK3_PARAO|nr:unnamed protein product [Parnassius apollo]
MRIPFVTGNYTIMVKPKKKATAQEKLAKDRLRKKEKYAEIKKDPEKYRLEKEKERKKYLLRKEKKKILSIAEMTDRQKGSKGEDGEKTQENI